VRVLGEFAVALAWAPARSRPVFPLCLKPPMSKRGSLSCAVRRATVQHSRPRAVLVAGTSLHQADPTAAGFHVLLPLEDLRLVEITTTSQTDPAALEGMTRPLDDLLRADPGDPGCDAGVSNWYSLPEASALGEYVGQVELAVKPLPPIWSTPGRPTNRGLPP
jgi:hypothetical protein